MKICKKIVTSFIKSICVLFKIITGRNGQNCIQPVSKIKYFHFHFLCLLSNNKYINYFLKTFLSFYMMFFSQFPHVFSVTTHFTNAPVNFSNIYKIIGITKSCDQPRPAITSPPPPTTTHNQPLFHCHLPQTPATNHN